MKNEKPKFRPTALLPDNLDSIVVMAVYQVNHTLVLALKSDNGVKLPVVKFDHAEPIASTVRREVYGASGCLLRYSSMFGVIEDGDKSIACYVGAVGNIENVDASEKRLLINIDDVIKKAMKEQYWDYDSKVSFLHYGFEEFKLLERRYWDKIS